MTKDEDDNDVPWDEDEAESSSDDMDWLNEL